MVSVDIESLLILSVGTVISNTSFSSPRTLSVGEFSTNRGLIAKKPITNIAAILVVSFFVINPLFVENSSKDNVRGNENDVFDMTVPTDSISKDSISTDTI